MCEKGKDNTDVIFDLIPDVDVAFIEKDVVRANGTACLFERDFRSQFA